MKTIIFDLGETLIYFKDIKVTGDIDNKNNPCINQTISYIHSFGYEQITRDVVVPILREIRKERHQKMIELGIDNLADQLIKNFRIESGLKKGIVEIFSKTFFASAYIDPHAHHVLKQLKKTFHLGIISNSPFGIESKYSIGALKKFKIDHYFDFTTFSSDLGIRKPHPEIFSTTISNNSLEKHNIVYVGNSEVEDIEVAKKVGIKNAILIKQKDQLNASGVLLEDLPDFINLKIIDDE